MRLDAPGPFTLAPATPIEPASGEPLTCRFLAEEPSGTTSKFDCVVAGGDVVKVKYGRNSEIHAEMAATRLLRGLGYAADDVTIARRVRCYGCPRYPFITMRLLSLVSATNLLSPYGLDDGYTDFEWVAVERKFPAAGIETGTQKGWGWWELKASEASPGELDAFRLLAVFLAHWDNKAENQRLVCLDARPAAADTPCARPVAMMQDLGSTFGPTKVNLAQWHNLPVWKDRRACTVSMRLLPFGGATFPDARISEAGRLQLARQLESITDGDIERLFAEARFPQFLSGTDDTGDLAAWQAAFRHRVDQIVTGGPCPDPDSSLPLDGSHVD